MILKIGEFFFTFVMSNESILNFDFPEDDDENNFFFQVNDLMNTDDILKYSSLMNDEYVSLCQNVVGYFK